MRIWEGFQHGINFGGWLSQGEHSDKHYETFLTETDFAVAARWGLDHVRIPVDYELVETEGGIQKESGFQWIAQCITWCRKYGLHMILDLHKTAGYTFDDPIHSDEFFTNPALQARFISLWQEFAKRYGKDHDVVAFELLNEIVNAESAESWNRIAANAVAAIRSVAQKNYILIGGIHHNGADGVPLLDAPADSRIVYNFHCYEPIVFTHQTASWTKGMPRNFHIKYPDDLAAYRRHSAAFNKQYIEAFLHEGIQDVEASFFEANFAPAIAAAEKYDIPLYCGEYGVIDQADTESTLHWYRTITSVFDKYHIGRAAWTYKETDFGLTDSHMNPILPQVLPLL